MFKEQRWGGGTGMRDNYQKKEKKKKWEIDSVNSQPRLLTTNLGKNPQQVTKKGA